MIHDELQRRGIYIFTYRGTGGVMDRFIFNAIQYLAYKNGWVWLPFQHITFDFAPEHQHTTISLRMHVADRLMVEEK